MTDRKTDYFGSFLGVTAGLSNAGRGAETGSATAVTRPPEPAVVPPQAGADPLNEVLKALLPTGERSMKDLLPIAGGSISAYLATVTQLEQLGLVEATADGLRLTGKGRDLAGVVA